MVFPIILAFVPLFGAISAVFIAAIKGGKPGEGSVFMIEGQSTIFIIMDGEKHPISVDALEAAGFDIGTRRIPIFAPEKVEEFPTGIAFTLGIIQAMKIRV